MEEAIIKDSVLSGLTDKVGAKKNLEEKKKLGREEEHIRQQIR